VRRRQRKQRKGPLQLDLSIPLDFEYDYSVIGTNKVCSAGRVIAFQHGHGSQVGTIGELKSAMHFDYIPCRKRLANENCMLAAVYAHNLLRLLQMQDAPQQTNKQWTRPAFWIFRKAESFRRTIRLRAGRLSCPKNRSALTISDDEEMEVQFEAFAARFQDAA
jgi:hypothetical protein